MIKEINKHNKTVSQEERFVSEKSYIKNYKLISGAPSNPWSFYGKETWKEIRSQIHDWKGKIGRISREEVLKPEELIKEINKP